MGWAGAKNGILIGLAVTAGFEVLVTADRNMAYQQNVSALRLALVVLRVPNNTIETVRRLVPEILAVLARTPKPGTVTLIGSQRTD
jgi:hypothetical protein